MAHRLSTEDCHDDSPGQLLLGFIPSLPVLLLTPFMDLGLPIFVHNLQDDARLLLVVGFSVMLSELG